MVKLNEIATEYDNTQLGYGESKRRMVNLVGQGLSIISGITEPTGTVRRAAGDFAETVTPVLSNISERLMESVHRTYDTDIQTFMQEHPIRDEDGNII